MMARLTSHLRAVFNIPVDKLAFSSDRVEVARENRDSLRWSCIVTISLSDANAK